MRRLRYAALAVGCTAVRHALMNTPLSMQFGTVSAKVTSSEAQQVNEMMNDSSPTRRVGEEGGLYGKPTKSALKEYAVSRNIRLNFRKKNR